MEGRKKLQDGALVGSRLEVRHEEKLLRRMERTCGEVEGTPGKDRNPEGRGKEERSTSRTVRQRWRTGLRISQHRG